MLGSKLREDMEDIVNGHRESVEGAKVRERRGGGGGGGGGSEAGQYR